MYCSLTGCSFHGIFLVKILEWITISSSRESSWLRDWTHISCVSCIAGRFLCPLGHQGSPQIYERRPIKGDSRAFWVALVVKNPPTNVGDLRDTGSIPGSGRFPEGGMATHSSILAWKSHGQESCRLQSTGSKRVRHDWSDLAHTRQGMIPSRYVIFSASSFRSTQGDIKNGNYFLTAVYIKLYGSRPVFINLIEIMDPFESHLKHCI